jgi:RND family efflux transporter MFP subunit
MPTISPLRVVRHAAAILAALLIAACSKPAATLVPPKPVRVQQVVLAPAGQDDSYTGSVRARVESEVAFRVGGKVVKRHVEVGQRVRAGDVIAELDGQDYALGVSATINQQQAAAVDAEQAASDATRWTRLAAQGFVSQTEAERYRSRADAARERVDQARRQVDLARNRAAYAVLRAPFDGVVTALRMEAGQVVGEGQPVATLAALGEREIAIDIPESRVLHAKRSTAATASLWAVDGTRFPVTLRELSPAATAATRTYRARYRIGPDAPPMELGMTATVWLGAVPTGSAAQRVATLPASALHHQSGQSAVWTVPAVGGTPTLVPVQVVRYGQDDVQVTGVRDGQLVVTAGVQKLSAGMSVVAVNADGNPISAGMPGPWPTPADPTGRTFAATASPTVTR